MIKIKKIAEDDEKEKQIYQYPTRVRTTYIERQNNIGKIKRREEDREEEMARGKLRMKER